jgi:dephospho-CoA kinase
MNAPDRNELRKAPPLIIALAGGPGVGRKTVSKILKHRHGFAIASFYQPVQDALNNLYSVSWADLLFSPDRPIEHLNGKSPRQLADALADHARSQTASDILIRRLVQRTMARGEWGQQDLVITDLTLPSEIQWIRSMGGRIWWTRRPGPAGTLGEIEKVALEYWGSNDTAIVNDATIEALELQVANALERIRNYEEATAS